VEQTSYEPKFREIGGLILDIDEPALSDLIDDHAFIEINKSRARFNLLEAMGGVRAELRHTNFLGFLLSPSRSHGLGSKPLQTVLRAILKKFPSDKRPFPALEVVVGDHARQTFVDDLSLLADKVVRRARSEEVPHRKLDKDGSQRSFRD